MKNKYFVNLIGTTVCIVLIMILAKILFFQGNSNPPVQSIQTTPQSPNASVSVTKTQTDKTSNLSYETSSDKVVSWRDAGDYVGQNITVEGEIVKTYNSGKACFLNFHPNYSKYFTVVIFKSKYSEFPDSPESFYKGKKVQVTGKVKEYQGKPEIILNSPGQIKIIK